ncbi:MAG: hypothetical protein ACI3XQ_07150 [Eubacteriales bacterium]
MKKYSIITYRLNKSVQPSEALMAMESLMQKYSAQYQNCLFKADVSLVECKFKEKVHSNRTKNAILSICKKYSALVQFFQHIVKDKGEGYIDEELSISNFSEIDYLQRGVIDYSIIHEIVTKIPRPYGVNHLGLIFDNVSFAKENRKIEHIKPPICGLGLPVGNYIFYERSAYGSEKHSYIYFSAEDAIFDDMRKFFFGFAEIIPGKYECTEIQND